MCTAVAWDPGRPLFGRTLDFEFSYTETVTVTPRRYPLVFRHTKTLPEHYALIGMAYCPDSYPLYYDAMNEKGLAMAGLYLPHSAVYFPTVSCKKCLTCFELIPWILGQCGTVGEAAQRLSEVHLTDTAYSAALPPAPLHWMLSDGRQSLVAESLTDGLHVWENPAGVLTNEPVFPVQLWHLHRYQSLSILPQENRFSFPLVSDSRGQGAMGLPGDVSSASRFVRAAFTRDHARPGDNISQFFHILGSVEQVEGCVKLGEKYEKTIYSACCDLQSGIYYYTTYENRSITGVSLHRHDPDASAVISYPLQKQEIRMEGEII